MIQERGLNVDQLLVIIVTIIINTAVSSTAEKLYNAIKGHLTDN